MPTITTTCDMSFESSGILKTLLAPDATSFASSTQIDLLGTCLLS